MTSAWALGCIAWLTAAAPAGLWKEPSSLRISQERTQLAQIARRALGSVVALSTTSPAESLSSAEPQSGYGTAFVIHEEGYLLTSSHVVEGTVEITAHLHRDTGKAEPFPARVVGFDAASDIALLKVECPYPLPVLTLSSANEVDVADWVVLIGNPFGLSQSVSVGVVSYKGRLDVIPAGRSGTSEFLQTDAAINPGSSGGPLLDLHGHVVAIANSVNIAGQGIGFATPIDVAKKVLPKLWSQPRKAHGRRAVFRAQEAVFDSSPGILGAQVVHLMERSLLALGGLQVGDVVLQLNRHPVDNADEFIRRLNQAPPDRWVHLSVNRHGRLLKVTFRKR